VLGHALEVIGFLSALVVADLLANVPSGCPQFARRILVEASAFILECLATGRRRLQEHQRTLDLGVHHRSTGDGGGERERDLTLLHAAVRHEYVGADDHGGQRGGLGAGRVGSEFEQELLRLARVQVAQSETQNVAVSFSGIRVMHGGELYVRLESNLCDHILCGEGE